MNTQRYPAARGVNLHDRSIWRQALADSYLRAAGLDNRLVT